MFGRGQSPEYAGVITKFLERLSKGHGPIIHILNPISLSTNYDMWNKNKKYIRGVIKLLISLIE
jgi:hypothetical protein